MKTNANRVILAILLAIIIIPYASAYDFIVDDIAYTIISDTDKTVSVSSKTELKYSGDVIIPSSVTFNNNKYIVTTIEDKAFEDCAGLTDISIPNSVTSIGYSAFRKCTSLTGISLPNSVTSIGSSAFERCSNLKSVSLPNFITGIKSSSFSSCNSLESIIIPNSVTSIGNDAFGWCTNLKRISLPSSLKHIGYDAFYYCKSLENVILPNSITAIYNSTFYNCKSLKTMTIPNLVTTIGTNAFYGCTSLESVSIPNSVTKMETNSFEGCKITTLEIDNQNYANIRYFPSCKNTLTWLKLGNSVKVLDNSAFANCNSLVSVSFPSTDTYFYISPFAFQNCAQLTSIKIPKTVKDIGQYTFKGCSALVTVELPDSLETIGHYAFSDCSSLRSVTIPSSVKEINEHAFWMCSALEYLSFEGKSRISINSGAFSLCNHLKRVEINKPGSSISDYAFSSCSNLSRVTLPDSVWIGENAFRKCDKLKHIISNNKYFSQSRVDDNAFNELDTDECVLHVPVGTTALYRAQSPWNQFTHIVESLPTGDDDDDDVIPSTFTIATDDYNLTCRTISGTTDEVKVYSFFWHPTMTDDSRYTAILPGEVEYNGKKYTVTALGQFTDYSTVTTGERTPSLYTFFRSTVCKHLIVPNTVKELGVWSFKNFPNVKLTLPEDLHVIGSQVFTEAYIQDFSFLKNIRKIEPYAFEGAYMSSIDLSDVDSIGDHAFEKCPNLVNVDLGTKNKYLGYGIFVGTPMTELTIPDGMEKISGSGGVLSYSNVKVLNIGKNLKRMERPNFSINGDIFNCSDLDEINIDPENEYFSSDGAVLYSKAMDALYSVPSALKAYFMPDEVTTIGFYVLPGKVPSMFRMGKNVTHITDRAFSNVSQGDLNNTYGDYWPMIFPVDWSQIRLIGNYAMPQGWSYGNDGTVNPTTLTIPSNVEYIGTRIMNGFTNLQELAIESSPQPFNFGKYYSYKNIAGINESYRAGVFSKSPLQRAFVGRQLPLCEPQLFDEVTTLSEVEYGDEVEYVDQCFKREQEEIRDAFEIPLKKITLGQNVKMVNYTFTQCAALEKIVCHSTTPPAFSKVVKISGDFTEDSYEREEVEMGAMPEEFYERVSLSVPAGSEGAYIASPFWAPFFTSGVKQVQRDAAIVTTTAGSIHVSGADNVMVSDLQGRIIYHGSEGDIAVTPGAYIVRTGNQAVKVLVR